MTGLEPPGLPVLGLMLGDFTGIGPEQCARVLADRRLADAARLLVVGDARVLQQGARDAGVDVSSRSYAVPEDVDWSRAEIPIIDLANLDPSTMTRGRVSADSGRISGETLRHMIDLARDGRIDGITFAPLNKAALHAGGWRFNDEHQMFAHLTGHQGFFGEMNVLDNLWMSRVTSHVSLRTALDQITPERIDQALTLADRTMRGAGFDAPRIAVAALNPHGGENGLFGREEIEIIAPAVARGGQARRPLRRSVSVGHRISQGVWRRLRRRPDHVSRPGSDRDQAQRLQSRRHRDRRSLHGVHDAGAWHRVRHRREGPCHHRRAGAGRPPGCATGRRSQEAGGSGRRGGRRRTNLNRG